MSSLGKLFSRRPATPRKEARPFTRRLSRYEVRSFRPPRRRRAHSPRNRVAVQAAARVGGTPRHRDLLRPPLPGVDRVLDQVGPFERRLAPGGPRPHVHPPPLPRNRCTSRWCRQIRAHRAPGSAMADRPGIGSAAIPPPRRQRCRARLDAGLATSYAWAYPRPGRPRGNSRSSSGCLPRSWSLNCTPMPAVRLP